VTSATHTITKRIRFCLLSIMESIASIISDSFWRWIGRIYLCWIFCKYLS